MMRTGLLGFLLLGFLSVAWQPAWAVQIVYNEHGRPIEFHGVMIGGHPRFVEVSWTSAKDTYEQNGVFITPPYWGDNASARLVCQDLRQALLDDGFTKIELESYLMVPTFKAGVINGMGVYLHTDDLTINTVSVGYSTYSGQVGFTQFHFFKDGFETR